MEKTKKIRRLEIVMDNGGGCTLQTQDFAHNYDNMFSARADAEAIEDGEDTSDWDGNEEAHRVEWTQDDISNGSYRVYDSVSDVDDDKDSGWANVQRFAEAASAK